MAVKDSNKSSKSTREKKAPKPPAEHQPVKQIAELPIVLVEIRELAHRLEEKRVIERDNPLDEITGADLEYVETTSKIKMLVNSCIQTIKLEGLAALIKRNGITLEEKKAIEDALYYYHHHCWSALPVSKQEAVKTMIALFEALQIEAPPQEPEGELIAKVNPISNTKEKMDQVFNEAAKMEVPSNHFVGLKELLEGQIAEDIVAGKANVTILAPEYPGIGETIDREIDLVTNRRFNAAGSAAVPTTTAGSASKRPAAPATGSSRISVPPVRSRARSRTRPPE